MPVIYDRKNRFRNISFDSLLTVMLFQVTYSIKKFIGDLGLCTPLVEFIGRQKCAGFPIACCGTNFF